MTRTTLAVGALTVALAAAGLAVGYRFVEWDAGAGAETFPITPPSEERHPDAPGGQGFLYGRITTVGGTVHEGRIRFGGTGEAFWGDTFNGVKVENPWVALVPEERRPTERRPIEILGLEIADREHPVDLERPFMARFGDIARIEALGDEVRVTLKSGAVFDLDRWSASDFDDGVRVWDGGGRAVDLDSLRVRTIEFLATPALGAAPYRLHGTVRTRQGEFSGFVQWGREKCVGSDDLIGRTVDGTMLRVRFDSVRSIERRSGAGSVVTLLDGREVALSATADVGEGNRGMYVDDRRYGRVLISWGAFERVDFGPGGSGPAYDEFPPGRPLRGSVTTRSGERLFGRLVFDLDESETVETLDAPFEGVDFTIPLDRVASIEPPGGRGWGASLARVTLDEGDPLYLEPAGDLGAAHAGMLVLEGDAPGARYVPWSDVARIDFDRP